MLVNLKLDVCLGVIELCFGVADTFKHVHLGPPPPSPFPNHTRTALLVHV